MQSTQSVISSLHLEGGGYTALIILLREFYHKESHMVLINCDWFAFSIKIRNFKAAALPEGFEVEYLPGNNIFNQRAIYRCRGAKVLTTLCQPKSKILPRDLMLCEVANRWLYDRMELRGILDTLYPTWRFSNISRVDICADFELTDELRGVILGLSEGRYYVGGKKLGVTFYEETKKREPYCMNFGSVQSSVKWKLYNKTKEIAATSPVCSKPYIKSQWKQVGFDCSRVWRLEVSFHGERFRDDVGNRIGLDDMYNTPLLRAIFAEFYKFRFQVKERGHTRKVNDRAVSFIDLPEVNQPYINRQREVVRGRYDDEHEALRLLNRCCQSLCESKTLSEETRGQLYDLIKSISEEYGYSSYVADRYGFDPRKVLRG